MASLINANEKEPAMLYETIACHAFNCSKLQDPGKTADADFFKEYFFPSLTHDGMHAMYGILDQLITKEKNTSQTEDYYGIRNSLEVGMDPESSIELLVYLADLINGNT
jgi:hypothetical protein